MNAHEKPVEGHKIGYRPFEAEAYFAAFNDEKWRIECIVSLSTRGKAIFSAFLRASVLSLVA